MKDTNKKLMVVGILVAGAVFVSGGALAYQSLTPADVADAETLSSVDLANQQAADSTEDSIQLIENVPEAGDSLTDNVAPVITTEDVTIDEGTDLNILDGVTAKDNVDKDVTDQIQTEGTVDTQTPGTYEVKLSVTDKAGNTGTATKTVTVNEVVQPEAVAQTVSQDTTAASSSTTTADNSSAASDSSSAAQSSSTSTNVSATSSYSAMTMYLAGTAIPYQNGGQGSGQSIIDSNPNGTISTWGGAAVQSGTDGLNTHFIGHNPGIFSAIFSLGSGSQIVVTDSNGTPTTYTVSSIFQVDDSAVGISDGVNYWSTITGSGGGERITLQACVNDTVNLIVVAYA